MTPGPEKDGPDKDGPDKDGPDNAGLTAEEREVRRRRLAEVFGDVLPDQTSDDADEPDTKPGGTDEWLRQQVPPHHGQ